VTSVSDLYTPADAAQVRWAREVDRALRAREGMAVRAACLRLARQLRGETILGADGRPYLVRYQLAEYPRGGPRVYLHHFQQSDQAEKLHNHPWDRSVSLILAGGYREHRHRAASRLLRPGDTNEIRASDFHRIELVEADAWTVFRTGRYVGTWEFLDVKTGRRIPWREFASRREHA
jgi:hypothetical protein